MASQPFDFQRALTDAVRQARQDLGQSFQHTDKRANAYYRIATVLRTEAQRLNSSNPNSSTADRYLKAAIQLEEQAAGSSRDANGRPVQPGLVYAARIARDCEPRAISRAALCDQLRPGMAVQAEIKTGRRRIIQYLLSPISQAVNEAGRER